MEEEDCSEEKEEERIGEKNMTEEEEVMDRGEVGEMKQRKERVEFLPWQGACLDGIANVRGKVKIHVLDPAPLTWKGRDKGGNPCLRVLGVDRRTEAVCILELPEGEGHPAAIFRDCPEFRPYTAAASCLSECELVAWGELVNISVRTVRAKTK
jgi:hypothetical protein